MAKEVPTLKKNNNINRAASDSSSYITVGNQRVSKATIARAKQSGMTDAQISNIIKKANDDDFNNDMIEYKKASNLKSSNAVQIKKDITTKYNVSDAAFDKKYKKAYAVPDKKAERKNLESTDLKDYYDLSKDVETGRTYYAKAAAQKRNDILKAYGITNDEFNKIFDEYRVGRDKEYNDKQISDMKKIAKNSPLAASMLTTGINLFNTPAEGLNNLIKGVQGKSNPETDYLQSQLVQAGRDTVTEGINNEIGKKAYNIGMGGADMLGQMALATLTGGGSALVGGMQGLGTANDVQQQSLNNGNSQKEALLKAALSGGVTAGLSKFGVDELLKFDPRTGLGSIGKGILTEGLEEGLEDRADKFIDNAISDKTGSVSNYEASVRNYEAMGMSREEAEKQATKDSWNETLQNALSGAIMGGTVGGIRGLKSHRNTAVFDILNGNKGEGAKNYEPKRVDVKAAPQTSTGNVDISGLGSIPNNQFNAPSRNIELKTDDYFKYKEIIDSPTTTKEQKAAAEKALKQAYAESERLDALNQEEAARIAAIRNQAIPNAMNGNVDVASLGKSIDLPAPKSADIPEWIASEDISNLKESKGALDYNVPTLNRDDIDFGRNKQKTLSALLADNNLTVEQKQSILDKYVQSGRPSTDEIQAILANNNIDERTKKAVLSALNNGKKIPEIITGNYWLDRKLSKIPGRVEPGTEAAKHSGVYDSILNDNTPSDINALLEQNVNNSNSINKQNASYGNLRENSDMERGAKAINRDSNILTPEEIMAMAEPLQINEEAKPNATLDRLNDIVSQINEQNTSYGKTNIVNNFEQPTYDTNTTTTNSPRVSTGKVDVSGMPNIESTEINAPKIGEGKSTTRLSKSFDTMKNATMQNITDGTAEAVMGSADEYKYSTRPEDVSFREGKSKFENDPEGTIQRYINDSQNIATDADVDAAFMGKQVLDKMLVDARNRGDVELSNQINEKLRDLKLSIREAGTRGGELINAYKKWAATDYEAVELAAYDILRDRATKIAEKKPAISKRAASIATEIKKSLSATLTEYKKATKAGDTVKAKELENKMLSEINSKVTDETLAKKLTQYVIDGRQETTLQNLITQQEAVGKLEISQKTLDEVKKIYDQMQGLDINSKEHVELESKAYSLLADEVCDSTFMDKWNAWRYFAMLSKPKTHIRNILGNKMFGGVERISDRVAGAMERSAIRSGKMSVDEATKSGRTLNNALVKRAKQYFNDYAYGIYNGSKYQDSSVKRNIENNKTIFNKNTEVGRLLNKGTGFNSDMLEREDISSGSVAYGKAMADFLQARKLGADIFDADAEYRKLIATDPTKLSDSQKNKIDSLKKSHDLLNEASEYAMRRANEATFHDPNEFAAKMTELSQGLLNSDKKANKALGMLIEGIIPFKKTPMNILRQGFRYSPLQYGKVLSDYIGVKNGTTTRAQMYEDASKAVTGSVFLMIGAMAARMGLLKGKASEGEKLQGYKDYSLDLGGYSVPVDFLAPAALPVLAGASVYEKYKANNGSISAGDLFNVLAGLSDPIVETSMLDGLNDVLETIAYANTMNSQGETAEGSEIMSGLLKAGTSYATQGIPGLLQSAAQTIDPTYRSARANSTGKMGIVEQAGRQSLNKIPGLSALSPASVNTLGEVQKAGSNPLFALFNSAINPTSVNKINNSAGLKMVTDLENQGYGKAVASKIKGSAPIYNDELDKNENVRLNGKEYEAALRTSGQAKNEALQMLSSDKAFNDLSPELQESIINKAYNLSDKLGWEAAKPNEYKSEDEAFGVYKKGGMKDALDYIVDDVYTGSKVKQINDEYDLSLTKDQYRKKTKDGSLNTYVQNASQAKQIKEKYGYDIDADDIKNYKTKGATDQQILFVEDMKKTIKGSREDGDSKSALSTAEILDYVNDKSMSDSEKSGILKLTLTKKQLESEYVKRGLSAFEESYLYQIFNNKNLYDADNNGRLKKSEINTLLSNVPANERAKWRYVYTGK